MNLSDPSYSREVKLIYQEAKDISIQDDSIIDTAYILLAMFIVPSKARELLKTTGLGIDYITDILKNLDPEPLQTWQEVFKSAIEMAKNTGSNQVTTLHLLSAITKLRNSRAYQILSYSRLSVAELRMQAISMLSNGIKEQVVYPEQEESIEQVTVVDDKPQGNDFIAKEEQPVEDNVANSKDDYLLDPEEFPILTSIGRNLLQEVKKGLIDPVVERDREIQAILDILDKRKTNNPLLIGEPGVGKTAIVEGIARLIVGKDERARTLWEKVIIAVNSSDLIAGTQLQGSLAQRLKDLRAEMVKAGRRVIVFFDEIHTILKDSQQGEVGIANEIKGALARGEFTCIGATTYNEYERYIKSDPALVRRFELINVKEPDLEEADRIIQKIHRHYEEFHGVRYSKRSLYWVVRLSVRFMPTRSLPDKALSLLDLAGARVKREGRNVVMVEDVEAALSEVTGIPVPYIQINPQMRLQSLKRAIEERMPHLETDVLFSIASKGATFANLGRPLGVLLINVAANSDEELLASVISQGLFGDKKAIVDIDLADYTEAHSISQLIGSPPGYVGFEEGGLLSRVFTRMPFATYLWRNIDRAHESIKDLLIQIFSRARITDRRGNVLHFSNTFHLITDSSGLREKRITGFVPRNQSSVEDDEGRLKKLSQYIDGRLDISLPGEAELEFLVNAMLEGVVKELDRAFGIRLKVSSDIVSGIVKKIDPKEYQAGILSFKEMIWSRVVQLALTGRLNDGDSINLEYVIHDI